MLRFWKCDAHVEMLNGFLQRIAENDVLGFNNVQNMTRLRAQRLSLCLSLSLSFSLSLSLSLPRARAKSHLQRASNGRSWGQSCLGLLETTACHTACQLRRTSQKVRLIFRSDMPQLWSLPCGMTHGSVVRLLVMNLHTVGIPTYVQIMPAGCFQHPGCNLLQHE